MASSLFNALGAAQQPSPGLIAAFQQFKKEFTGDPRQQVKQLLDSGQMTQDQYNQIAQMANQLVNFLK